MNDKDISDMLNFFATIIRYIYRKIDKKFQHQKILFTFTLKGVVILKVKYYLRAYNY